MTLLFRDNSPAAVPDKVLTAAAAVGAVVRNDRAWFTATLLDRHRCITAAHEMRTSGAANESVIVFNLERDISPAKRVVVPMQADRFVSVYGGQPGAPFPDYAICGVGSGADSVSPALLRDNLPTVGEVVYVVSHIDKFVARGEGFKAIVVGKILDVHGSTLISHSAQTIAGDSGSAVFDAEGRLVGIHIYDDPDDDAKHLAIAVNAIPGIRAELTGTEIVNPVYSPAQSAAATALFEAAGSLHPLLKKPLYPFQPPHPQFQELLEKLGHTPISWDGLSHSVQLAHVKSLSEQIGESWNVGTLKLLDIDGTNVYKYWQPPAGPSHIPIGLNGPPWVPTKYASAVGYPAGLPSLTSTDGKTLATQADYKRAFCVIRVRDGSPEAFGTGVKVGPNAILTARHVIPCAELLPKITFDFLSETPPDLTHAVQFSVNSFSAITGDSAYFASEDGLASLEPWNYFSDFAIVKLKEAPDDLALKLSKTVPEKGSKGFVLGIKRDSDSEPFANRTIGAELGSVLANANANEAGTPSDTGAIFMKFNATPGDSGGLVVDSQGNAYGVFTHGHESNPKPLQAGYSWGTAFWHIAEEVKRRNPKLLKDCPSLAQLLE